MEELTSPHDKFKFFKKWFWIGIVVASLNSIAGLIYGIALLIEKEHRREGLVIIIWAVIAFLILYFLIGPWLIKAGVFPRYEMVEPPAIWPDR